MSIPQHVGLQKLNVCGTLVKTFEFSKKLQGSKVLLLGWENKM
jgi:hypothetical protein